MKRKKNPGRRNGLNHNITGGRLRALGIFSVCILIAASVTACKEKVHPEELPFNMASSAEQEREYTVSSEGQITEAVTAQAESQITETDLQIATAQEPEKDKDKQIVEIVNQMTMEEKIAQLFVITPEQLTGYDRVTQAGAITRKALADYPVGGLILFSGNLENETQLKQMTRNLQKYALELEGFPLFLSIDEEGGSIARLGNHGDFHVPRVPDMCEIGISRDTAQAYEAGNTIGSYLNEFGINVDFAPVADVLTNPRNTVVKTRSFGSDPDLVTAMVTAYMEGLNRNNVYGVPKHFPGHGVTEGDSHLGFARSLKTWQELEKSDLIPFYAMTKQQAPFIMVGHISLPEIIGDDTPASLSPNVIRDYLREEMGYNGVIITDALNMGAIEKHYSSGQACVMALKAGADLLLMPTDFKASYEAVLTAVDQGELNGEMVDEAVARILQVKLN